MYVMNTIKRFRGVHKSSVTGTRSLGVVIDYLVQQESTLGRAMIRLKTKLKVACTQYMFMFLKYNLVKDFQQKGQKGRIFAMSARYLNRFDRIERSDFLLRVDRIVRDRMNPFDRNSDGNLTILGSSK